MTSKYFLSLRTLFAFGIISVLCTTGTFAAQNTELVFFESSPVFFDSLQKDEKSILKLINEERQKHKLNQLIWDASLSKLARAYSVKMARENFFSHRDTNGKNLVQRARDFNINGWRGLAENLYKCRGYDDPAAAAVKGWLKSPAHRSNFLSRKWSATGIGVAKASDGTYYVTQVFLQR